MILIDNANGLYLLPYSYCVQMASCIDIDHQYQIDPLLSLNQFKFVTDAGTGVGERFEMGETGTIIPQGRVDDSGGNPREKLGQVLLNIAIMDGITIRMSKGMGELYISSKDS